MKISFAHNVYNRKFTLLKTIQKNKKIFPDSEVSVAYNYPIELSIFENISNLKFHYFKDTTHKIGCSNGFIISIKNLKEIPDVIFFSHDDVRIADGYEKIFLDNCNKILTQKHDIICRKPKYNYGDNYYMMEGVFMNGNKIKEIINKIPIFKNENDIPKDIRKSISPEVFLYELFSNKKLNIKVEEYNNKNQNMYNNYLAETMGLEHLNIGIRGWNENE
jgi:hypothetical protein